MNDFTKDDLIDLAIIVSVWCVQNPDDNETRKLFEKIESMIDNYCVHENLKDIGKSYKVCRSCGDEINE